jgi:hypothetical protein
LRGLDSLEILFSAEDPGVFTTPWSTIATAAKPLSTSEPFIEIDCAENNLDASTGEFYPIPTAEEPDFNLPAQRCRTGSRRHDVQ